MSQFELLQTIQSPDDIKGFDIGAQTKLCAELREKMIDTVSKNGGHLASNLGVVELTVALHRSFQSPEDQIVFDVGHQCYAHKLLTGRYELFHTLRRRGGISGFPSPEESEHDIFYSGHSSTSVSWACGLARAKKLKGEKGYVIAVIGDGSLTGGEAYEGLNNAPADVDNLIIVINDNKMSISKNQSSLAASLAKIRSTKQYYRSKERFEKLLAKLPLIGRPLRNYLIKSKYALKGVLYHSSFFEDLGYAYLGPVDGHDLARLENIFEVAKHRGKPCVIHVDTVKGKGYAPAQENPERFHGIGPFDKATGQTKPSLKSFSSAFGDAICSFAAKDKRICAVTAAMPSGTGLSRFAAEYPQRYFDVGIAEQHAVTFSAGLAKNGMVPIFAVYSTFLQRAYDQIIHDVALQKQKVIFSVDRAGFVGSDGQTHQGLYDIAMFNSIPNIAVFAPSCFADLAHQMYRAVYLEESASAIRYPRGGEPLMPADYAPDGQDFTVFEYSSRTDYLIVSFGRVIAQALQAQYELSQSNTAISVLKLNKIKPIHPEAIEYAKQFKYIYFYEEGMLTGGVGEHFTYLLKKCGFNGRIKLFAVDNTFVKQSEVNDQLGEFSMNASDMIREIKGE